RAIIEQSPISIQIFNKNGLTLDTNNAWGELWQLPSDELIGKYNVLEDEYAREIGALDNIEKAFKGETSFPYEIEYDPVKSGNPGRKRYVKCVVFPIKNEKGEVNRVVLMHEDITERKQAVEKLRESEKKYRDLFEKSEDAFLVIQNGKFIDCNQAAIKMLRYSNKDELLMMHPSELSPEKQADGKSSFTKANKMMKIAFKSGSHRFEWIHKRSNGETFPVEVLLTAISTDEENQIIHTVLRDITERNQTEELLQKNEEKYRLLADNSMDAIWQMDKKLVFTYISPSVENILGYTVDECVGTRLSQYVSIKDFFNISKKALYAIKNYKKFKHLTFEAVMLNKDGTEVPVEITARLLLNEKGLPIGLQGTTRDITNRKRAEKDLKKHHEHLEETVKQRTGEIENKSKKLEESQSALTFLLEDVNEARIELESTNLQLQTANKEMESFTYSVSHDLRAPLRAILGFSNKFTEVYGEKVDEEGMRLLNVINTNTKKMGMLIDDMLAFSRMGRSEMRKVKVDIKGLAHETWNEQKVQYADRNIELAIMDMPVSKGDRNMLRQVLFNLLSNAAKFSKYKEVSRIEVGARAGASETVYYVKDNGAGFDMRYKDKLFQVFQRLHNDREFEGTGVGLAIVKKVIDMHGGKAWAESEPDQKTTIYFSLPK
ncbi:MAG: PAS domain S-box protein, partial [Bacteroidales bacterium]|nr:PAS domain S-box protein [Bacteroidales bacterium]